MTRFVIREYQPGDEAAINRGFNDVFGCSRGLEEWRWKFGPDAGGSRILLGFLPDGELTSHFAALVRRLQLDGREVLVGHAVDIYSRRQGATVHGRLYQELVRTFYQRYGTEGPFAMLYGFPGDRHLTLGRSRLSFSATAPLTIWRRSLAERRAQLLWRRARHSRPDTAALDDCWRRIGARYRWSVIRDAAWVHDRYVSHPQSPYQFVELRKWRSLQGWLALRVEGPIARCLDLVWDGEHASDLHQLVQRAADIARVAGATTLEIGLGGDDRTAAWLERHGWSRDIHPARLSSVSFDPRIDAAEFVSRFYFTLGDTDLH